MAKRKSRKSNNIYFKALSLTLLAFFAVIIAIIVFLVQGCDTSPEQSDSSIPHAETSEPVSDTFSREESDNAFSADDTSEPEEDSSEPEVLSYEERVGQEYAIDIEPYLEYIEPSDPQRFLILVNLANPLDKDYVPENMVVSEYTRPGRKDAQMVETAAMALKAFLEEGKHYGVNDVTITNAYRSYSYQSYLFALYTEQEMDKDPSLTKEEAEALVRIYSMPAGCSEHQTGLTCDMHNISETTQAFGAKPEAKWLADNCYRFGFILRYPEDKQNITGVKWEPWHFRFVGREAATQMHELDMCLEEYIEYLSSQNQN